MKQSYKSLHVGYDYVTKGELLHVAFWDKDFDRFYCRCFDWTSVFDMIRILEPSNVYISIHEFEHAHSLRREV